MGSILSNKVTVIVIFAALVIGALVYLNPNFLKSLQSTGQQKVATSSAVSASEKIEVTNQTITDFLIIPKVTVENKAGGFVAINKLGANNTAEATVGISKYLTAGTYTDLKINLFKLSERNNVQIKSGDTLNAFFVVDDGDKVYNKADKAEESSFKFKAL